VGLPGFLDAPLATLADLVCPPHCMNCGVRQPPGRWLCEECSRDLPRITGPKCAVCSRPYDGAVDVFLCPNCHGHAMHLDFAVSVMRSKGIVRELIHRFKYGRERQLRRILAGWLCEAFADERLRDIGAIAFVPLHPARQRERQFNQAEALADAVARAEGLRLVSPLRRVRYTITQTHFDRKQRMRNLRGAFALRQNAGVKDKSLLLVDDVLTTGSTLDECARVLLEGGARRVCAITVARG